MRQIEISRTIVFDAPRHARGFFEALVADNLDLGRPESVEIIFGRHRGRKAGGVFKTAIDRHTQGVTINVFYKHSRVKQYLKNSRALRIETVIDDAYDIGCQRLLPNLDALQVKRNSQDLWIGVSRGFWISSLVSGSFDELALLEPGAGADEGD
jgi:hypothetical protein